jgi:hypothetical protein
MFGMSGIAALPVGTGEPMSPHPPLPDPQQLATQDEDSEQDESMPRMGLACSRCGWAPHAELTVGVVAAHVDTAHPGVDYEDLKLDLRAFCAVDGEPLGAPSITEAPDGRVEHRWRCPECGRRYLLTTRPDGRSDGVGEAPALDADEPS